MKNKYYAIILAAGLSSRMGVLKPLLPVGDSAAIVRVVKVALTAGVTPVVVTGHRAGEIEAALVGSGAVTVHNPIYEEGMFTSVLSGAKALPADTAAFFMLPADCCAISPDTLTTLIHAFEHENSIVYPAFEAQRGHPPIIPGSLIPGLLEHDGADGARGYFRKFGYTSADVPDGNILLDMDTPADYARLLGALGIPDAPDEREQYELLRKYGTPDNIILHGEQVRELATRLSDAMNARGCAVNTAKLRFAALAHDISRREDEHAQKGALLLLREGYPAVSELVRVHMDIPPEGASVEAELLYIADKLMRRGRFSPPEETLRDMRTRFAGDAEALYALETRMNSCILLIDKYYSLYGIDIVNLLKD